MQLICNRCGRTYEVEYDYIPTNPECDLCENCREEDLLYENFLELV